MYINFRLNLLCAPRDIRKSYPNIDMSHVMDECVDATMNYVQDGRMSVQKHPSYIHIYNYMLIPTKDTHSKLEIAY